MLNSNYIIILCLQKADRISYILTSSLNGLDFNTHGKLEPLLAFKHSLPNTIEQYDFLLRSSNTVVKIVTVSELRLICSYMCDTITD